MSRKLVEISRLWTYGQPLGNPYATTKRDRLFSNFKHFRPQHSVFSLGPLFNRREINQPAFPKPETGHSAWFGKSGA
jgi:hypothetical protein